MLTVVFLGLLNLGILLIGLAVGEYELAKLRHPEVSFLPTPQLFDCVVAVLLLGLTICNVAVLVFVWRRKLHQHLLWLRWTTSIGILLVLLLGAVLDDRFWKILFLEV